MNKYNKKQKLQLEIKENIRMHAPDTLRQMPFSCVDWLQRVVGGVPFAGWKWSAHVNVIVELMVLL